MYRVIQCFEKSLWKYIFDIRNDDGELWVMYDTCGTTTSFFLCLTFLRAALDVFVSLGILGFYLLTVITQLQFLSDTMLQQLMYKLILDPVSIAKVCKRFDGGMKCYLAEYELMLQISGLLYHLPP